MSSGGSLVDYLWLAMIALMARQLFAISLTNSRRVRGGQHIGAEVALELKPGDWSCTYMRIYIHYNYVLSKRV
jgi:hypothetical protein